MRTINITNRDILVNISDCENKIVAKIALQYCHDNKKIFDELYVFGLSGLEEINIKFNNYDREDKEGKINWWLKQRILQKAQVYFETT